MKTLILLLLLLDICDVLEEMGCSDDGNRYPEETASTSGQGRPAPIYQSICLAVPRSPVELVSH